MSVQHNLDFDPTHGYNLERLFQVGAPETPPDFQSFWETAYEEAMQVKPLPRLLDTGVACAGWNVFDLEYQSTQATTLLGWVLIPEHVVPKRGFVITHGYGGRECPDYHLPFHDAVLFFPCLRGLGKSRKNTISADPYWHVLHNIDKPQDYVLRGCVQDVWLAVSALLRLFPSLEGHIGYFGESFGGGIGALSMAWEPRVARIHLAVPTFGNHPLRVTLQCNGSGASLTNYYRRRGPAIFDTLKYYDAAVAARFIKVPVHCVLAKMDPAVPPAGQFSVFNAIRSPKYDFLVDGGHLDYPWKNEQLHYLGESLHRFFADL